jgi:hypothetical protein
MKMAPITIFLILIYSLSIFICNFLGEEGREIVAHFTGLETMACCLMAAIFISFFAKKISSIVRLVGSISFWCLSLGYFFYLWLHISPSNFAITSHAVDSILFDVGTTGTALLLFMMLNINNGEKNG